MILLGDCHPYAISNFLRECFNEDHHSNNLKVIILRNCEPSDEMNWLLKNDQFISNVIYIKGDPLNNEDLKRCNAEKASCCIIMNHMFESDTKS